MTLHQFCMKLEHSSAETILMIQKAVAMGNWHWLLNHDNVPAHASCLEQYFGETPNHAGDSAPLQPRFDVL